MSREKLVTFDQDLDLSCLDYCTQYVVYPEILFTPHCSPDERSRRVRTILKKLLQLRISSREDENKKSLHYYEVAFIFHPDWKISPVFEDLMHEISTLKRTGVKEYETKFLEEVLTCNSMQKYPHDTIYSDEYKKSKLPKLKEVWHFPQPSTKLGSQKQTTHTQLTSTR
jgi:hypothetical protein